MKYTVNLYQVNDKGFLTARACMKSALQLGGGNIRDTRLLSAEMPEWNTSPWFAPVPMDEYAYMTLRAFDIRRAMPDLRNPEVVKYVKEKGLDLQVMRGILATDEKSYGGLFLQYLMSYPRWVNARGEIEIGGEDYFTILQEMAEAEHNAIDKGEPSCEADTQHIATISDRTHQRMERAGKSQDPTTAWRGEEADMRGGIDKTSALFLEFVNMVGAKTGCNAAAGTVINTIKRLIELLGSCGINDFNTLEAACNNAEDALSKFCCALAEKQDVAAQAPVKAVIIGPQADELAAAAADAKAAVAEMDEWRGYIKQLIAGYDGDGLSPSPLTANKQQAIYKRWDEYTTDCKRKHTRPTYKGCLDEHGEDNIYKGHTLLELVQTEQGLEKVVHNVKEQARRK